MIKADSEFLTSGFIRRGFIRSIRWNSKELQKIGVDNWDVQSGK